jgi:hypothetical protein
MLLCHSEEGCSVTRIAQTCRGKTIKKFVLLISKKRSFGLLIYSKIHAIFKGELFSGLIYKIFPK